MADCGEWNTFALEGVRLSDPCECDGASLAYIHAVSAELSS
jgi:hypothetical protein